MTNNIKKIIASAIFIIASFTMTYGQITSLSISERLEKYRDSLKRTPYEWHLPVMGEKIRKMGFDIPYPNGISFTYGHSSQDVLISEAFIGFDPDELLPIDGIARFSRISSDVNVYTARYDFWLLPFLNLYAIGGNINAQTKVELGLPFEMEFMTKRNQGITGGWGAVLGGAVGPMILSANYGMVWTKMKSLDQANQTTIFGARTGYLFRFRNPERNLAVLVGAQYLGINKYGSGDLNLISTSDKDKALDGLNGWYENLTDREQEVLEPLYSGVANWLSNEEPVDLYYEFNKSLISPWSANVGFNYQINKRYTLTGLYNFGNTTQIIVSLGYRFGFKGKNYLAGLQL